MQNKKIKKILIATGIYPPDIGGPATYSKLLFDELPKRNVSVVIVSFGEVRRLPKIIRHISYFFKVLLRVRNADIIFAQDPVSVGLPAMLAAKLMRKRFMIRVAGDYAWEQAWERFGVKESIDDFQSRSYGFRVEFLRIIQRLVVNNAEKVFTPSKYFSALVSKWCKRPDKVNTIYNGIKLDNISIDREKAREAAGILKDAKVIFTAGRLVPWKGFDTLIKLVAKLALSDDNWRLIIAGDGPEKEYLMKVIRDMHMGEKVRLLGQISRSKVFDFLGAADVFVLNTSFESFSFQIVEAMAVGVPVVATQIGNLSEIVESGVDGILVPFNDEIELIAAIKMIDEKDGYRDVMIAKAKIKATQFSIDSTINNLLAHIS